MPPIELTNLTSGLLPQILEGLHTGKLEVSAVLPLLGLTFEVSIKLVHPTPEVPQ